MRLGKEWEPRRKHAPPQRSCRDCKRQRDTMESWEWRTDGVGDGSLHRVCAGGAMGSWEGRPLESVASRSYTEL